MLARLFRSRHTPARPASSRPPRRPWQPLLETLEDRCVPAVYNVNTLQDVSIAAGVNPATGTINSTAGLVTLRSAIQAANNTPGNNTINLTLQGDYRINAALGAPNTGTNASGAFAIMPTAVTAPATANTLQILNTSGGVVAVDGAGFDRVFDINPGNTNTAATKLIVAMQGFTITNGVATPGDAAPGSGGGIRDQGNTSLTLTNMLIDNNSATADGGGVSMENAPASTPWTLTVITSRIANNRAGDAGGGLETDGSGKVFVTNTTITGNNCVNQGAGIWLDAIGPDSATLSLTQSIVSGNVAVNGPTGGIGNAGNGAVSIVASTVDHNFGGDAGMVATGGGGFGDEGGLGTLVVLNSTFVGNSSTGNGGGIEENGPSTTINDSTITGNFTLAEGGGLAVTSATFVLNNTIVAGNVSNAGGMNFVGVNPDVLGAVTTGSGNFIGVGGPGLTGITNGTNGNQIGSAASPKNPLLGPLQNNGGPTPTEAPLPGSPVIGTGTVGAIPGGTSNDQRVLPRTVNNTVDIGAVEFQTIPTNLSLTASTTTVLPGQTVTLTATVTAPPQNTITFPTPQGSVTFLVDGRATTVPLMNGTAALTLSTLTPGPHTITATYNGDTLSGLSTSTSSVSVTEVPTLTANIVKKKGRFIVQVFLNGTMVNQVMLPKGAGRIQQAVLDVDSDGIPDLVISFVQNKKKKQIAFDGLNGQRL